MSVAEQAIADSRRIVEAGLLDVFFPDANGNVLAASNADFYNAFLNLVGGGEAYRNRDGSVRQNLSPRIRAAVLAAMLNPERRETVERLLDNPEGYTALINGLMQSAANLAELANKAEYDLSGELSEAVELFVEMRDKGQTVAEFAAQADMFRDAPSEETMFLLRLFEENAKSSGGISGVLRQYAAECKKIDTTTQSLFGEANPSKLEKLEEAYRHYAADLSNEAGNGNLRWRDTGEPAAEEIPEAQKQYEEVKSKYMGTPLWLKAPNGKPTNLTEEQWLQVRTPNFKRWFGDWEKEAWAKAAMDFLENTAPVSELSGGEFQKDGVRLTDKVSAYFNSIGNIARNEELGDVVLDKDTVKASMSHGIGRLKASAFMAVKDVIEKGFIFNREINWKDRGYDTAVIVAPIKIGGENYACEIVVKKNDKRNSFYLHEVEIKKTLEDMFKTTTEGAISQASKLILGKHLAEVNGKVSKAVDENGEPLVVYHGSGARFTEFKREFTGIGNDQYGSGFYFTTSEDIAKGYTERRASFNEEEKPGGESSPAVINAYLSVRNPIAISDARKVQNLSDIEISSEQAYEIMKLAPLIMDREESPLGNFYESYWEEGASDSLIRSLSQEYEWNLMTLENDVFRGEASAFREAVNKVLGYDGVQINFPNGEKHFVAWFPEQIKSATDNVGTFSGNPDIRWREVSETKRAADEWANNSENVRKLTEEYLAEQKGQIVVDPDRIRAKLPNYEVSLNSDFVEAGDNVLEEVWKEALKRAPKDKPVVLLTGNPAAGKGTAIKLGHLNEVSNADLVFDAPQNKFTSVEKRVKEAANAGHRVFIIQIYNDPITSWKNSLKRGIGKDNPKTGKREGGRFLPLEYFVRVYESAQGKVEKIENILKQNYKDKLETKYIDNTGNNPIVVSADEALAWDYSISDDQLKEIEGITDEYRGRIEESARLRGDKKDPLAVIGGGVSQVGLDSFRVSSKGISRRTESGDERDLSKSNSGGETRLKALLRQERSENPDIRWRLDEGAAELDARHAELYERYKGGDEAAYGEALELVADEARRNGYDVKVYHGTGADGFNVAKADASEAHYGEGAQSHGLGLYMAEDRDTAIGYRGRANKTPVVKLGGKTIDYKEMGFSSLDELIDEVYELRENNPLGDTPKSILNSFSQKLDYWRAESEKARKEIALGKGYGAENLKEAQEQIAYIEEDAKKLQKWAKVFGEGQTIKDLKVVNGFGRVFDWLHNMKPDELLDEQLRFSKQNAEVKKKLRKLFKDNGKDLAELMKTGYVRGNPTGDQIYAEVQSVLAHGSEAEASRLLSKHGIRGITYDGRQDGRCFVSFEGGATVKLQDPFTFDDDGKLIPLSRRFDRFNPDIRWKIDDPSPERVEKLRAARPVEIGENDYKGLYELNAKSAREYVLKKLRGRKYVNADTGDEIEIGQTGTKKIASHDRYNKDYLRTFAAIPQMIENAVYLGEEPNEKGNGKYDKYRYYACGLKIGGRDYTARLTIGELKGKWYYDQALTEMEKGDLIERLLKLSKPVWPLTGSPNGFIDNRLISLLQENNSENSSRLRFLLRQDRRENPVIWASIVLAKQILLGRAITNAKIDRVLPAGKFDGTKREYAINRAREIAERYRANREKFGEDLNLGVQRAESDLYWTRDVVEEMYASFRRDGEEYGIAKQKLFEWLKEQRRRDLEGVRGLSAEELGVDVSAAIENALEKEPERAKPAKKAAEEAEEETFEASGEGIDAEIESAREKPAPSSIRDIIGKIRVGVTKAAKARGMDEAARRRAYRNTLAEVLRESAKRLTYGREREAIMKKISDLSAKGYSVIKIKDGERAGQKIDNYTLRAEHIALRIFNRGVRDTKRELSEKFEKIVSRKGKKPSRMERDDKRALAGAVQMRVYNIKRYSEMDAAELEAEYSATVDRLENVEKNFAEDAGKGEVRSDIEDIRAEVANANAGEKTAFRERPRNTG